MFSGSFFFPQLFKMPVNAKVVESQIESRILSKCSLSETLIFWP